MSLRERIVKTIPLSRRGLNLFDTPQDVQPGYGLLLQNCFFRRGIQGRFGSVKHSITEVTANKKISGLHRFYYGNASKQLIAVSGGSVKYMDDALGTWTVIRGGQTDGAITYINTWGAVNKAYIANGVDAPFSWDGVTASTLSNFPTKTIMILPYRDRALFIEKDNPSYLRWTKGTGTGDSYVDSDITSVAESIRIVGGGQIQVISPHALAGTQEGINAMVFVATGSSCALFYATILDPASSGFDVRLNHVSDSVGTLSPRSVVQTPIGTIFLGTDKQIYLLQFGSSRLQIMGTNIRSGTVDFLSVESIPTSQLPNVCATYHDGFYKLAYAVTGQTTNKNQMWLDITNIFQDQTGRWGPWFGPMTGMPAVSCFTIQNQASDDIALLGGLEDANGYIYELDKPSTYSDSGTAIDTKYTSHHQFFVEGSEAQDVVIHKSEIETRTFSQPIFISFRDSIGAIGIISTLQNSASGIFYDEDYYDEVYYDTTEGTVRIQSEYSESFPTGRQISTTLEYSSSTDHFELQVLRAGVEAIPPTFGGSP